MLSQQRTKVNVQQYMTTAYVAPVLEPISFAKKGEINTAAWFAAVKNETSSYNFGPDFSIQPQSATDMILSEES